MTRPDLVQFFCKDPAATIMRLTLGLAAVIGPFEALGVGKLKPVAPSALLPN